MRKDNLLLSAILVALATSAQAGVNIAPFYGYHHSGKAWDEQRDELKDSAGFGYAKENGDAKGVAIGAELTPSFALEIEYLDASQDERTYKNKTKAQHDFSQQNISLNFIMGSDFITQKYDSPLKPYVLLGLGMGAYDVENKSTGETKANAEHLLANFGLGAKYRLNDMVALKSELRGIYNTKGGWFEGLALAGLQFTLGGHLKPVIPEPPMMDFPDPGIVEEPAPKKVAPPQPKDSDKDGVIDARDRCPNTARGMKVNAVGCTAPQKVELRVFFDSNKSVIKERFKPEIAKVANIMQANKRVTTVIEGHTSKTGSRKLNMRLSQERADAVKNMLVNQYGISPTRIQSVGYGWSKPIAPNTSAEGRALNRRVYALIK